MTRPAFRDPTSEERRLMTTFGVWLIVLALVLWGVQ